MYYLYGYTGIMKSPNQPNLSQLSDPLSVLALLRMSLRGVPNPTSLPDAYSWKLPNFPKHFRSDR